MDELRQELYELVLSKRIPGNASSPGELVYAGYRITVGMELPWTGRDGRTIFGKVSSISQAKGKPLVVIKLPQGHSDGLAVTGELDKLIADHPDFFAPRFDPALANARFPERFAGKRVGVDRIPDRKNGGYLLRSRVDAGFENGPMGRFLKRESRLATRLGFYYNPNTRVLVYPDRVNLRARLGALYAEWGVRDGVLPGKSNGVLLDPHYGEMIDELNEFPYSVPAHPATHDHDILEHGFGWVVANEAMQVARKRLRFLRQMESRLKALGRVNGRRELLEDIKQRIKRELDLFESQSTTLHDSTLAHTPQTPQRDVVRRTLNRLGGESAEDLRQAMLRSVQDPRMRQTLEGLSASAEKIGDIDEYADLVLTRMSE